MMKIKEDSQPKEMHFNTQNTASKPKKINMAVSLKQTKWNSNLVTLVSTLGRIHTLHGRIILHFKHRIVIMTNNSEVVVSQHLFGDWFSNLSHKNAKPFSKKNTEISVHFDVFCCKDNLSQAFCSSEFELRDWGRYLSWISSASALKMEWENRETGGDIQGCTIKVHLESLWLSDTCSPNPRAHAASYGQLLWGKCRPERDEW